MGWGQNPAAEVPEYNHFDNVHMATAGANNPDDIIVSIATDSQGYIYTLSFGNGVDKRNPDGSLLQAEFIPANQFQTPLDIVINSKDEIFIADYFESGSCLDNGKIKVFDSNGIFKKNIALSYFRPLGLALDYDDNIYIAEYYDGSTCENGEESRIRVFDGDGIYLRQTESVEIPYRLAVDSSKNIYVSQAGVDDNSQVLIFDANLNPQGNLPNIKSPGSIVVDKFDFIHVIDYEGYVDFKEFLNYENANIVSLALGVLSGMGEFNIKIFSSQGVLENQLFTEVRFPVDLIFNSDACDSKLFINNSDFNIIFPFENSTIEFDLEIYTRIPSFDDEAPIALCIPDGKEFTLQNGKVTLTVADINDGSTDNCGIDSMELSNYEFTITGPHTVSLIVTDEAGNSAICATTIDIVGETSPEPVVTCPVDSELPSLVLDANCEYSLPDVEELITTSNFNDVNFEITSESRVNNTLFLSVDILEGQQFVDNCELEFDLIDSTPPEITCPEDIIKEIPSDQSTIVVNYNEPLVYDSCGGELDLSLLDGPPSGSTLGEGEYTVKYEVTDEAGLRATCEFKINLTQKEPSDFEITCSNHELILDSNGKAILDPEILYSGQETNLNFEASQTEFDCSDLGVNQIVLTATDPDTGQTATCNAEIFIIGEIEPEAICVPSGTEFTMTNGELNLTPEDIDAGSTAVCELKMELSQSSFTTPGDKTITLTIFDESGSSDSCTTTISVIKDENPTNSSPVAKDDPYNIDQDDILNIALPGILNNDIDPDGDTLTAILEDDVQNGNLTFNTDGSFTYTPNQGFTGQDTFTYIANDGTDDSNVATVTIEVKNTSTDFSCIQTPITLELDQSGAASLQLDDLYTGDASGLNLVASQLDFTCDDLGENTIELSWTGGSSGSCEITVMVEDNIKPIAEVSFINVTLDANGLAEITPEDLDAGSYDNCGTLNFDLSKSRFTCEDTGQNTVALALTDASGNSTTVNTIVFVNANPGTCTEPARDNDYLFLYPNPTDGLVKIFTPDDVTVEQVFVFDKRGRFIMSEEFDKSDLEYGFRLDGVQNAVYTLRILTNEGEIIRRLIIRN
ncbi:Por secretion system C-terminal sorting domain-containing protein [Salegentibacter flavus]|uniref:Por secretion system C-terminal sorting domain-containing protein n=2 Tax=Salegentibacter flavus TaxID=287099 RepID=A0A1I4Y3N0_9FLAO|nr:Por secretion system C-terminal sorting domain-containing protein [Salegentibacter flavus]